MRIAIVMLFFLSFTAAAKAQAPVYHPGDVIKVSVTFAGKDAARISQASADVKTSEAHDNQLNFTGDFGGNSGGPTAPNTFEISIKVPTNATSGVYKLVSIIAYVSDLNINVSYNSPADFRELTYTVENSNHLERPSIKDVH